MRLLCLTEVLQKSYRSLTEGSQKSYRSLTEVLQKLYRRLTEVLQKSHRSLTEVLQKSNHVDFVTWTNYRSRTEELQNFFVSRGEKAICYCYLSSNPCHLDQLQKSYRRTVIFGLPPYLVTCRLPSV